MRKTAGAKTPVARNIGMRLKPQMPAAIAASRAPTPLEQEQLKPGIPKFVSEQDTQCFSGTDQITERPGFVSEYKHFVRHKSVDG